jgi:serine/threonine-protein kinase 24/25/MST4
MAHQYAKGACIGKGSFGEVFRGVDVSTGADVALKLVDLEKADEEIDVRQRTVNISHIALTRRYACFR